MFFFYLAYNRHCIFLVNRKLCVSFVSFTDKYLKYFENQLSFISSDNMVKTGQKLSL